MHLLHPGLMGDNKKPWLMFHYVKLISAIILFTPLVKLLPLSGGVKVEMQFYWILLACVLAPLAKYYREFMMRERERKGK